MNTSAKKILKIASITLFFLFIVIFAFLRSHDIIFGVKIKNVNIEDGATLTDNVLKVTGNARNAISLTLNDREISVNREGDFDETIILLSGYNIVNIKARDKFGYIDEKNYKLMFTPVQ